MKLKMCKLGNMVISQLRHKPEVAYLIASQVIKAHMNSNGITRGNHFFRQVESGHKLWWRELESIVLNIDTFCAKTTQYSIKAQTMSQTLRKRNNVPRHRSILDTIQFFKRLTSYMSNMTKSTNPTKSTRSSHTQIGLKPDIRQPYVHHFIHILIHIFRGPHAERVFEQPDGSNMYGSELASWLQTLQGH